MKWLTMLAMLVLLGCSANTEAGFKMQMELLLGKHSDDIVRRIGPPHRTYKLSNGNTILFYSLERTVHLPGISTPARSTTTFTGSTAFTTTTPGLNIPGGPVNLWCKIQFEIDTNHLVISYKYSGNNCIAKPPGLEGIKKARKNDKG